MRQPSRTAAALLTTHAALITLASPRVVAAATVIDDAPVAQVRFLPQGDVWQADALPVRLVWAGEPPAGLSVAQVEAAFRASAKTWSTVPCAALTVEYAGRRASAAEVAPDEVMLEFTTRADACFINVARYVALTTPECNRRPDDAAGTQRPSVLFNAEDYTWRLAPDLGELLAIGQLPPLTETPPPDEVPATSPRTIALEATLTHELGHVLGLGHNADNPTDRLATMAASYVRDGGQATLAADDRLGICTLYPHPDPARATTCASDASCRSALGDPGATCVTEGALSVCQEERASTGAYCAQDLLICDGLCWIDSPTSGTGYCTQSCAADTECPTGWSCNAVTGLRAADRICQPPTTAPADDSGTCAALPSPRHQPAAPLLALCLLAAALIRAGARHPHTPTDKDPQR